jgi:hypothetical protein
MCYPLSDQRVLHGTLYTDWLQVENGRDIITSIGGGKTKQKSVLRGMVRYVKNIYPSTGKNVSTFKT